MVKFFAISLNYIIVKNSYMNLIDLTHTLKNGIKEYPGDSKTSLKQIASDDYTLYKLTTSLHTGTHMDAPLHYIKNGAKISDLSINDFIGKAKVINCNSKTINPKTSLEEIVIINANWSKYWGSDKYFVDYPYISIEFAERLIEENVKGIAIDTCSVDKHDENKIHKKLLKNNVWIVENIANTDKLKREFYNSYFIPLKIKAEASPIRAFVDEI